MTPSLDTRYTISVIPVPVSDHYIKEYKALRLTGLKQDAYAFGSAYDRENAFTQDVWRSRLETVGRFTCIVHTGTSLDDPEAQWAGTAGVLTPAMLLAHNYEPPYEHLKIQKEETAPYDIVGMWVRPEHRRKGLASMLVEKLVEVAKTDQNEKRTKRVMVLQVSDGNEAAAKVYEKFGFVDRGPFPGDEEEETWMLYEIPPE